MLRIFIDADACPVKDEVYRVAKRLDLEVLVVSNSWMRTPDSGRIRAVVVEQGADVADDWIAEHVETGDVVVSADIPLAARCLEKGAAVLGPTGRPFTQDNIGDALASRDLMSQLRDVGMNTGGPPPLQKADRSRFLQALDQILQRIKRETT
ncbi:MAG: YaiI/YqxD family protein [Candidatus Eisenbacteria bacterium]